MVPYSAKEANCFICKEKFETVFDEDEETWYFTNARKIRLKANLNQSSLKKGLTFVVHTECLKQIVMNREL
jgi:hypothetical protein